MYFCISHLNLNWFSAFHASSRLQERLKQKRLQKEEKERQEQIARERMRRERGKEMLTAKQKYDDCNVDYSYSCVKYIILFIQKMPVEIHVKFS